MADDDDTSFDVVDPTGEAAAGTMVGQGPGTDSEKKEAKEAVAATKKTDWLQTSAEPDIRVTDYGGSVPGDQPGGKTYDYNSYHGIGDRNNQLLATPEHQSVALSPLERLKRFGVSGPSTGLAFTYNGKTYYDDDTAAQVFEGRDQGRIIDVYRGGGAAAVASSGTVFPRAHDSTAEPDLSKLPEHLDLDWDQGVSEQQTPVQAPPVAKSLVQQFREQNPDIDIGQNDLINQMHQDYAPTMPIAQFKDAVTTPGGDDIIKEWVERLKDPLDQIRDQHPEWNNYSDQKLMQTLYQTWTENGQLDSSKLDYDEFAWRMKPPTDALNQFGRFSDEVISEFLPKSASTALWAISGTEQHALDNAEGTVRGILGKAYSPDVDLDSLVQKYQKMTPQERRQEFAQAWASMKQDGSDSARLLDTLNTTFETIDKQIQIQESIDWMKKTLKQLDQPGPNQLPPNQEKWAQTIAALPSQAAMAVAPGFREVGLFGTLYAQNKASIEQNNPGMSNAEVARRAESATWWAFPGNELLQLSFLRGGPAIQGTIVNRIKAIGLDVAKEGVAAAGVGGANRVFTNIAAGRDPLDGVFEDASTMATLGVAGRGVGLTVESLARGFKHVPEIRQATNISSDIVGATPAEANKIIRGDPTAEVNQKATRNSIDLILSATQQRQEERRIMAGRITETEAAKEDVAGQRQKERDILAGRQPKTRGYQPAPDIVAEEKLKEPEPRRFVPSTEWQDVPDDMALPPGGDYRVNVSTGARQAKWNKPPGPETVVDMRTGKSQEKTPAQEEFAKATTARNNGDFDAASQHIDKGMSLLPDPDRREFNNNVADGMKGITRKNLRAKLKNVEEYMGLNDTPGKRVPKEAPKEEAAKAEATEEAEAFSGGNPLPFIRKAAKWFANTDQFQKKVDPVARTFAPEHRGEGAKETAAIVKPVTARVKNGIQQGIKIIAEDLDLNSLFHNAHRSDRRDAWWGNYSDKEIAAAQSIWERGGTTGNEILDKMFGFTRDVYDWLGELGRENGVQMGYLKDYFHHAFKNPREEVDAVFKNWEAKFGKQAFQKTRHYPTLQDAIEAGLIPKSYSPERNLMTYAAAMTTAIRQIQTLKEMTEFNLALPTEEVKAQGLTEQKGWQQYKAPDGKTYYVRNDAAGVLANAFDMRSIYDTIAGPYVALSRALKAATGLKLSWSVFHPIHIALNTAGETVTTAMQRALQGTGTAQDFLDALKAASTFGLEPMVSAYRKYGWLVDALQTGRGLDKLSDQQKRDYHDVIDMALNPYMGDDRRAALSDLLFRGWQGANKARDISELGYRVLTAEPWNKFFFGKVTPTIKIAAALARRDSLLLKHGEAYRSPENMAWKRDLSEINNQVEARFGEMSYDNLFWNRMVKQIGTAIPLSLGWNLGFWKVYGGGVVDLMDNVAHIDQIAKSIASGGKEGRPFNLSNRLLYMANYTVATMATNGLITYLMTQTMPQGMDWFFPRIGKKPTGDDERVRTPFWTGEWASMYEHFQEYRAKNLPFETAGAYALGDYFGNKANPGLAALYHFFNGKTFMGRDIFDKRDPVGKQYLDRLGYFLQDLLVPISGQDLQITPHGLVATDPRGIPLEPRQVIASFMGFTQAPTWTTRSPLQNEIITLFHDQLNTHVTKHQSDIFDAKTRYQYAIQAGDRGLQAEALSTLQQLGAGQRVIEDARKNARVPPAHRAYKGLNNENQTYLLKRMSPEEFHEYWPLTHHEAKMEYVKQE